MTPTIRSLIAAVLATGFLVALPSAARADTNLAGHWNSSSLRQDGVGYSLSLTAASSPATAYNGVVRFGFQDGRLGKPITIGLVQRGDDLTLVMPGGSLASGRKTLLGTLGQDGSIYFANCQTLFPHVTKKTSPTMCLFQQFPDQS